MNRIVIFIALFFLGFNGFTQEDPKIQANKLFQEAANLKIIPSDSLKPWKIGGIVSVNGQQVSLSNWAAGGNNSISVAGLINVFTKYKNNKITWENNLELGYGVIKQGNSKSWWKNDDKIQFSSKFGHELKQNWFATGLIDFRTQFTNGYNYPNDSVYISKFMAPGYILSAIGFDYKPNERFSAFIAPFTGKITIVNDDSLAKNGAFGVQKELRDLNDNKITQNYLKHREEFGAYLKFQYQTKMMENITFQSVIELFSNYLNNPENIDVNWSTLTTFKVNKYISANLTTQLIYDDDIKIQRNFGEKKGTSGPDLQFKQALAIGFTYKF